METGSHDGAKYEEAMEKMEFSVALTAMWQLIGRTNKYIDETQPWSLAKDEANREKLAPCCMRWRNRGAFFGAAASFHDEDAAADLAAAWPSC